MRRAAALIVGGGPAGAAAAIRLGQGGARPLLFERNAAPRDVVCGGFLGWDSLAALHRLGIDPGALGARPIKRLRLVSSRRTVEAALPYRAAGLSRRTLDEALLDAAARAGAEIVRGRTVRAADSLRIRLDDGEEIVADALLLATGKHEMRGAERDAAIAEAPIGLRAALAPGRDLARDLDGWIELHLFDGGYAGLLIQDDGQVNLCLSASRARLKAAGGAEPLVRALAAELPALAARLEAGEVGPWSAVAGVPYGWRARRTGRDVYRLGDQAAVIASLAGDGIAIALESGRSAAEALLAGRAAPEWQSDFARRSRRPIVIAEALRRIAERPVREAALLLLRALPGLAARGAGLTRIGG
ncbi:oxidoreductase [Sphingomonas parva]|uniref:Oxidoreductase n=1 Tax=Sphingomonas parva TaxID=2555898 RepID=A0A4Y8ZV68_9SPHN|nr:FAD-dependent oxidoreductase [Sphingomonas parva]TFI59918.1 oxidoreductase [Sphingomonas parva]